MGKKDPGNRDKHGNLAKVDKNKDFIGMNITNQAALAGQQEGVPPETDLLMVEEARRFSQENKK